MTTPIFYFNGRAKNLLPTLDYHMNINIPQVTAKVEIPHFESEDCPDHWVNIITFGKCWKHEN